MAFFPKVCIHVNESILFFFLVRMNLVMPVDAD